MTALPVQSPLLAQLLGIRGLQTPTGATPGINPNAQGGVQAPGQGLMQQIKGNPDLRFKLLLSAAAPLLAASSPGGSLGQGLSGAIQGGLGTINQEQQNQIRNRLLMAQIKKLETPEAVTAQSPVGKVVADVQQGFLPPQVANAAIQAASGTISPADKVKLTSDLRKEFDGKVKTADEALAQGRKVFDLIDSGTPIGVNSAMTVFLQALDGSVVRESERVAASQAAGPIRALLDKLAQVQGDGPATAQTKAELKKATRAAVKIAEEIKRSQQKFFSDLATEAGIKPDRVIGSSPDIRFPAVSEPPQQGSPSGPVNTPPRGSVREF